MEAAERLGCAEGTLSAWLHRGLAKLRVRLQVFDPKLLSVTVAVPIMCWRWARFPRRDHKCGGNRDYFTGSEFTS